MATKTITFLLFLFISSPFNSYCTNSPGWIRGGYWDSPSSLPISEINSALFTHLMCGFAFINSSTYDIFINSTEQQSFSSFSSTVKRKNPLVLTLLSIWGGEQNSSIFSSMINQSSYRKAFIRSSIESARLYGFDGLDFCGVLPSKSINMTNFGTFFDEWQAEVTSEARNSRKSRLLLAMTSHHLPALDSVSYPIDSMKRNLDWIHLVAFDYYVPTRDKFTGAHAALYGSASWYSTNHSIHEWLGKGMPANKLVLGIPYHGYGWTLVNPNDNAIGAPASGPLLTIDGSIGYSLIKFYIEGYGYGAASVYNHTYVVNFFIAGTDWINFDGVEAIRAKISYAKEKGMLGYNVFHLSNDDNWELSSAAKTESEDRQNKPRLMLIFILVTVAILVIVLCTTICCLKRVVKPRGILNSMKRLICKLKNKMSSTENLDSNANKLRVFSFKTIKEA